MPSTAAVLKLIRQIHRYLGIFAAPAILFFAITGALQTFGLHETTKGSDYKPPAWIVKLGQLHKKQTLVLPVRKPQPNAAGGSSMPLPKSPVPANSSEPPHQSGSPKVVDAGTGTAPKSAGQTPPPDAPAAKPKNLLPMKIFFLLVSVTLVLSTFTGIYMAYKFDRSKLWITGLLLAGIAVPILIMVL